MSMVVKSPQLVEKGELCRALWCVRVRGRALLDNLSRHIRECLRHAEDCAHKAEATSNAELRDDYLILESRWLFLDAIGPEAWPFSFGQQREVAWPLVRVLASTAEDNSTAQIFSAFCKFDIQTPNGEGFVSTAVSRHLTTTDSLSRPLAKGDNMSRQDAAVLIHQAG